MAVTVEEAVQSVGKIIADDLAAIVEAAWSGEVLSRGIVDPVVKCECPVVYGRIADHQRGAVGRFQRAGVGQRGRIEG